MKTLLKYFKKYFAFRWVFYSICVFVIGAFVTITGISNWPPEYNPSFKEYWQTFIIDPIPDLIVAIGIGFLFARYVKPKN